MRLLIIDNFFNGIYKSSSKKLSQLIVDYSYLELKKVINKNLKKYDGKIEIKVITGSDKSFDFDKRIKVERLSNFRLNINREEYIRLKNRTIKNTKDFWNKFYDNLNNLNIFHANGIFLGNLIEIYFTRFLNNTFGEFELLNKILSEEDYSKVIILNCNPIISLNFNKILFENKKLELFNSNIILKILKKINFTFLKIIISTMMKTLKEKRIVERKYIINTLNENKPNVIFIANTKNQLNSLNPIYNLLKEEAKTNPIFWYDKNYLPFKNYNRLIKYLIQVNHAWKANKKQIIKGLKYKYCKPESLIDLFYDVEFFYWVIKIFILQYNFREITKKNLPSLNIIADDLGFEGRTHIGDSRIRNIPILYIPHAAIPSFDEIKTTFCFPYCAIAGEKDKEHYINLGEPLNKLFITGRPRYDTFYTRNIEKLDIIEDMFTNEKYVFEDHNFTIILTTNPVSDLANERIITSVIKSLEKFNLLENLIIKLHPSETGDIHREVIKELNVKPIIVKDYDIFRLLKSCNLLISRKSTAILEAFLLGIPAIILDFTNLDFVQSSKYQFLEEGDLITVRNQNDLTQVVEELIFNETYHQNYSNTVTRIARLYAFYDGVKGASENISKLIQEILNLKQEP